MANIFDLSDVWNNVATTFNAIKMNVTNIESADDSKLLDLQVSGNSKFSVDHSGALAPDVRTAGEILAGIIPSDYNYPPGHVKRYGAVGDGVTDDLPAFNKAHDQFDETGSVQFGGSVIIPEGDFFLNGTWHIQKQLHIQGAGSGQHVPSSTTVLRFPANTDGLWFHSSVEAGYNNANQSTLRDLTIFCNDEQSTGNGLTLTTRVFVRNVWVTEFAGDGVYIFGSSAGGTGTPNQWSLIEVDSSNNGGNGLYVEGSDTNAGTATACNFKGNDKFGVHDKSGLGNTYISCHFNANGIAHVKSEGASSKCVFLSCYAELAGNNGHEIDPPSMVIGGYLALVPSYPLVTITGDGTGATAVGNSSAGSMNSYQITNNGSGYTTATVSITKGSGSGATATANIVDGKIASISPGDGGSGYSTNSTRVPMSDVATSSGATLSTGLNLKMSTAGKSGTVELASGDAPLEFQMIGETNKLNYLYWNESNGTYDTTFNNSGSSATRKIVTSLATNAKGGRTTQLQTGTYFYPQGLWLGGISNGRHITSGSAMPTSGEYAKGDRVFNTNPSVVGGGAGSDYVINGWIRLVTGSNHVLNTDWAEMRSLTGT